jgi:hypothetical protein
MTRALGVASPQSVSGKTYAFSSWSDGGQQSHNINTPVSDTSYTVNFTQTAGPVDVSVAPRADAYVRDGASAGTNFGNDTTLVVKRSSNTGNTRETHIKFDLTGITAGAGQTIKLRLWGKLSDTTNNNLSVGVYPVADATWGETTLTWNNRPTAGGTALATRTISGTTLALYEFDVTNYVRAEKGRRPKWHRVRAEAREHERHAGAVQLRRGRIKQADAVHHRPRCPADDAHHRYRQLRSRAAASRRRTSATDPSLLVKLSASLENVRESFLKFDLSTVSSITSAKLRLFGKTSAAGSVTVGAYSSTNTSWTEGGVTFNNRPSTNGGPLSTATISGTTGTFYEWNITSFLQAEKAAGRNTVTIALKATGVTDPWAIFDADSSANSPQIVVA